MATRRFDAVIAVPFGKLGVTMCDQALVGIDFLNSRAPVRASKTVAARKVCEQIRAYFADPHFVFDLPLVPSGTTYQRRVWRALRRIPAGQTQCYGGLARRLATSARAIGHACRANPIPIVVPCHRVIARNGPGGFMGKRSGRALDIKCWLLAHERAG